MREPRHASAAEISSRASDVMAEEIKVEVGKQSGHQWPAGLCSCSLPDGGRGGRPRLEGHCARAPHIWARVRLNLSGVDSGAHAPTRHALLSSAVASCVAGPPLARASRTARRSGVEGRDGDTIAGPPNSGAKAHMGPLELRDAREVPPRSSLSSLDRRVPACGGRST